MPDTNQVLQILRNLQQRQNDRDAIRASNLNNNQDRISALSDNIGLTADAQAYNARVSEAKQILTNQFQQYFGGTVNIGDFLGDYLQNADAQAIAKKYFPGGDMPKIRNLINKASREYGLPASVVGVVFSNSLQKPELFTKDTDIGTDDVDMAIADNRAKNTLEKLRPVGNEQSPWKTTINNMIALANDHANVMNQMNNLASINQQMASLSDPRMNFDSLTEDTKRALVHDYNLLSDQNSKAMLSYTDTRDAANAFLDSIFDATTSQVQNDFQGNNSTNTQNVSSTQPSVNNVNTIPLRGNPLQMTGSSLASMAGLNNLAKSANASSKDTSDVILGSTRPTNSEPVANSIPNNARWSNILISGR